MGILANENSISAGGYTIERSLRFQSASSQYLARTPASAGNRKTWTLSAWVKRGALAYGGLLTVSGASDTDLFSFRFESDTIKVAGSVTLWLQTTQVFRDPSAWYHLVLAIDTTQATASNRIKLYVNGSQITAFSTASYPAQNADMGVNRIAQHNIGCEFNISNFFDGYMAEVNFIDGQALTPSSFGETDALTGVWVAKRYTGTYGTNGFYLKFNDGTSTTTLGQDRSGNANNWTLTNFTRSAGVSDCWMYDVPSGNGSPSATQPSSNYCVMNPLDKGTSISCTNANLNVSLAAGSNYQIRGTVGVTSGKWYWECIVTSTQVLVGIATQASSLTTGTGADAFSWSYYGANGQKFTAGVGTAYGATFTTNDVIGIAFDADAGTLTFYKNNVSQGTAYTGLTSGPYFPAWGNNGSSSSFNFGQRSFAYTPPSGFKALCTANLPAPTIAKGNQYMDATLYTGNGSARSITNDGSFSPDLVWIKGRSGATDHALYDAVRGTTLDLVSNSTAAETTQAQGVTAFNSNGFSIGTLAKLNTNTATYVAWQWDAGSSTVTNTSGTISSQVRANTTAGFSIVTYTGTGANATVGHGLGVAPKMVIVKNRDQTGDWCVYHVNMNATPQNYYMQLNLTGAAGANSTIWNNTAPTSTTFSIGSYLYGNTIKYVAYCFAEIAGFSKFGSYTGNGSADGTFVYTGFRPKFVMYKRTDSTGNWFIDDSVRLGYNVVTSDLLAEASNAEANYNGGLDILSNGFKQRATSNGNASGGTYIYMAFAESPFSVSNAR